MMKTRQLTLIATGLMLVSAAGWTADGDGEATIRLMGAAEAELPAAVTKEITIPTHLMRGGVEAQQRAVQKAERGLGKAEERQERREKGRLQADEARDRSTEMSEKASENRENRGRSDDRPTPPDGPPDLP